jgi:thiamine pyrophosphate-dependent acetolactate synthase large subunit-like protein
MHAAEALKLVMDARTDEVVIATMGAEREWVKLSQHPRDFFYVPSSMGQAPTLGLGLAMARPDLRVVVLNGDGCMLMNLGCLVTIAEQSPRNYALVVFDNGVYEVTGGQATAGRGRADFAALARAAGLAHVLECHDLASWQSAISRVLRGDGPVFVVLDVQPIIVGDVTPRAPCPMPEQLARFRAALSSVP